MEQIVAPLLFGLFVFVAFIFILRQFGEDKASTKHRQKILNQIYEEQGQQAAQEDRESASILKSDSNLGAKFLLALPGGKNMYGLVLKAGLAQKAEVIILAVIALFFVLLIFLSGMVGGAKALLGAAILTYFLPKKYLTRRIEKRNEAFINMFPDAVDMIVRSVKSGHPLNTALKMISENMDPPMSTEFKQLIEEIAFGRSTTEALVRLSTRIDEPDLHFFVVILSVQQETGGNLAEVLSNLSGIIRKRKQLRLKIKAMTSEGRATAYILGSLPLIVFGAIHYTSPDYLMPLFTTEVGNMILGAAVGLIGLAAFIIKNMLNFDI